MEEHNVYPKWLILLMGLNLLSLLLSPFFLFGGVSPASDSSVLRFLGFVAVNLFWLVPSLCFFFSLDTWGKGHPVLGITIGVGGIFTMLGGAYYLFCLI